MPYRYNQIFIYMFNLRNFLTIFLRSFLFNPFVPSAPFLYPLKTSENFMVFGCFQGVEKRCIWNKWVKEIVYWQLPHLSLHWLIMQVGFEFKRSKLKSSVNRFNLFKVLIVSSTSYLQGCANCSSDSSSSFSSSPSVITSAGCLENSETIYSTDNGRNWLVPSRQRTSRNVELIGSFFVRSISSNAFSASYFVF